MTRFPEAALDAMLPTGIKDFLPAKAAKIEHLTRTLQEIFSRWSFRPIIPPPLEYLHVLEKGLGEGLREKTFRFDDRQSGKLVAFSPDITPQVARIVATRMREMPLPLRLCYAGRVLRHAEQQAGKDREIFQAGVELIGLESPEADAEMIAMAVECLRALGASEFTVDIGQVEFFRGVMAGLPLSGGLAREVQSAIGRKDVSELQSLMAEAPVSDRAREEVLALPRLFGGREVLERAQQVVTNERSRRALDNLFRRRIAVAGGEGVITSTGANGAAYPGEKPLEDDAGVVVEEFITFDLGELRGLDYHTGVIFQGFLPGVGRAVCSGGRYDALTARYGYPAPATGFAFDLLNLLSALDRELDQAAGQSSDVLIFQAAADKQPAQRLARALRQRGYAVARDIIPRDLEATLEYARKMQFRYVLINGEIEGEIRLVRVIDGLERRMDFQSVLAADFTL